jgi:hypothetical protein
MKPDVRSYGWNPDNWQPPTAPAENAVNHPVHREQGGANVETVAVPAAEPERATPQETPTKTPVWNDQLQAARFRKEQFGEFFDQMFPEEARLLADYECRLEGSRTKPTLLSPLEAALTNCADHQSCDCDGCRLLLSAGHRRVTEEIKPGNIVGRWAKIAEPTKPEPALVVPDAPPFLPEHVDCLGTCCRPTRKKLFELGWLWSTQLRKWIYAGPR